MTKKQESFANKILLFLDKQNQNQIRANKCIYAVHNTQSHIINISDFSSVLPEMGVFTRMKIASTSLGSKAHCCQVARTLKWVLKHHYLFQWFHIFILTVTSRRGSARICSLFRRSWSLLPASRLCFQQLKLLSQILFLTYFSIQYFFYTFWGPIFRYFFFSPVAPSQNHIPLHRRFLNLFTLLFWHLFPW